MNTHKQHRGFTLIEMLIVIGIIALLAALTLGISSSVMKNAKIRKTEDALKLMTMALQEWELEKGRAITFEGYVPEYLPDGVTLGRYDMYANEMIEAPQFAEQGVEDGIMLSSMYERMKSFVNVLLQSESGKEILSKISPDLFIVDPNETDRKVLVDSWGTPVGVVFPGRNFVDVWYQENPTTPLPSNLNMIPYFDQGGDQTVRDEAEDALGSCINVRPYFVSAGPDKLWGYRSQSNAANSMSSNSAWVASTDNIYSYLPFLVESAR